MSNNQAGTLYIVATPIGNLADITFRAVEILRSVNCIAAEDTRHSNHLLRHYGIQAPTLSLHRFNEKQRTEQILQRLQQGQSVAVISDAGTPVISDPGYLLVKDAQALGITVVPVPGACAAIAALSAAGLDSQRFAFEGFLPATKTARCKQLEQLVSEERTLVFYESPHRIVASLTDMQAIFGDDRQAVVARELTKTFETIRSGNLAELLIWVQGNPHQQKGEFVLIIAGAIPVVASSKDQLTIEQTQLLQILLSELPLSQAVRLASQITGMGKNLVYRAAVALSQQQQQ